MANEEESDLDHSREKWLAHEFTQRTTKVFQAHLKTAEQQLEHACQNSTDPVVRGAYAKALQLRTDVAYFSKAGAK